MKPKQKKALRRHKQKQKETRMHQHSYRSNHPHEVLQHPKPLSKDEIMAMRRPASRGIEGKMQKDGTVIVTDEEGEEVQFPSKEAAEKEFGDKLRILE